MIFKFLQDPSVVKLFDILAKYSIDARFVGGVVRDELLYTVKDKLDFDIAVAYDIEDVCCILERESIHCIATNIAYKTIIAIVDDIKFEITELREDRECDSRHCKAVSATEFAIDAKRRDFTINALYLDRYGELYDYCGAISNGDIKNRLVRFIGDPARRIQEDYLRILRYYRFCAIYNDISCIYKDVIRSERVGLLNLSTERIQSEFFKTLDARYCINTLLQMHYDGIFDVILTNISIENLRRIDPKQFSCLSITARLYLLFGNKSKVEFRLSKCQKKVIDLYDSLLDENLEYVYHKHGAEITQDVMNIRSVLRNNRNFYKISPIECGIDSSGFNQKLQKCERWYVDGGYKATKDECIEFIKLL